MVLHFPLNRFVITASSIGIIGSLIGIGLDINTQHRVKSKSYCLKALNHLENNTAVANLIGKPIEITRPDVSDKSQIFGSLITDINVPFQGTKKSGMMHIVADRAEKTPLPNSSLEWNTEENIEEEWNIRKLELKFNDIPNKVLIVYNRQE